MEGLWRTVKYEEIFPTAYANEQDAKAGLDDYFRFYNTQRPHQALGCRTPADVFDEDSVKSSAPTKERRWFPGRALVSYAGKTGLSLNVAPKLSN